MTKNTDEPALEEIKGSITEAIGKITASPSTEKDGAAMRRAARQREAKETPSNAAGGDKKS